MQFAKGRRQAPPIDPAMAAKGRVDRVKVKHWGTGKPEDLGELELDQQQPVEEDSMADVLERPLYEALGKVLEQLQVCECWVMWVGGWFVCICVCVR